MIQSERQYGNSTGATGPEGDEVTCLQSHADVVLRVEKRMLRDMVEGLRGLRSLWIDGFWDTDFARKLEAAVKARTMDWGTENIRERNSKDGCVGYILPESIGIGLHGV